MELPIVETLKIELNKTHSSELNKSERNKSELDIQDQEKASSNEYTEFHTFSQDEYKSTGRRPIPKEVIQSFTNQIIDN